APAASAAVSSENDDIYEAIEEVDFLPEEEAEEIIPAEESISDAPAPAEYINENPQEISYDYDEEEFPVVGSFKPNETFDDDPDFLKDFDFEDLDL
ncbi:MAG: hypothetical protein HUJ75_01360, partial [Parasporobacterium sp.]|nr:hypothetical protein [Parasporobacterium sp.]